MAFVINFSIASTDIFPPTFAISHSSLATLRLSDDQLQLSLANYLILYFVGDEDGRSFVHMRRIYPSQLIVRIGKSNPLFYLWEGLTRQNTCRFDVRSIPYSRSGRQFK
jgi:hypothetical protein